MKRYFEEELRNEDGIARKNDHSSRCNVSRPDSRPASPSSPYITSPQSIQRRGVKMGFSLSLLLKSLMNAADSVHRREIHRFFRTLELILGVGKACEFLERFIDRRMLNHKFHTLRCIRVNSCGKGDTDMKPRLKRQTILPVEATTSTMPLRAILTVEQCSISLYVGLGKVVGVLLSVLRMNKLDVIDRLRITEGINQFSIP